MQRIPSIPPPIASTSAASRPLWSVMIPAYNCIQYLPTTIASVLHEDQGSEQMEIIVVDDCSTDGNVEQLVADMGKGRIGYFRQPVNVGSVRNFEKALNLSTGHFIHLLHGDDAVKPGFYKAIKEQFDLYPEAGMVFTQNFYINSHDIAIGVKRPMSNTPGLLENWYARIARCNYLEAPAAVVKRSVYEHLGGFFAAKYGEDWEMWVRIAKHYPVAYIPEPLAMYRKSTGNISFAAHRSLQSIKDIYTIMAIIQRDLPDDMKEKIQAKSKNEFSKYFAGIALEMGHAKSKLAFAMARKAIQMDLNLFCLYAFLKTGYQWAYLKSPFKKKTDNFPVEENLVLNAE